MRCFATAAGEILVEWALAPTDVLRPDRTPLGDGGTFYLLDEGGRIVRSWTTTSSAVQEHLGTTAYVIEGDALVDYYHGADWGHEEQPSLSPSPLVDGLRLLPAADAPSEEAVGDAIARYEAAREDARAAWEQAERDRLGRFERTLPEPTADEPITLVWRYDGADVVIAQGGGEELWRETDWPWMGKDFYRRLRRVAEQKYGERLAGFVVDVPPEEYLRFDND